MTRAVCVGIGLLLSLWIAAPAAASTQAEIDSARAQNRTVFLVVTDARARGADQAVAMARKAQGLAPRSAVVMLDRGALENAELVKQYRVLGAPLPLILVVAPNGIVAGGARLRDASPEKLVKLIPTPKKAELLLALNQKKAVFIVVSRKTMRAQGPVFEAVSNAFSQMRKSSAVITVDLDDKAERGFVAELKVDPKSTEPTTIVFNLKAQKTGKFVGAVTAKQLVETAIKKAPCCPGGSC